MPCLPGSTYQHIRPQDGQLLPTNLVFLPHPSDCYCLSCGFLQKYHQPRSTNQAKLALSFMENLKPANVSTPPIPAIVFGDFLKGKFLQSPTLAVFVSLDGSGLLTNDLCPLLHQHFPECPLECHRLATTPQHAPTHPSLPFPAVPHKLQMVSVKVFLTTHCYCYCLHAKKNLPMPPIEYSSEQWPKILPPGSFHSWEMDAREKKANICKVRWW